MAREKLPSCQEAKYNSLTDHVVRLTSFVSSQIRFNEICATGPINTYEWWYNVALSVFDGCCWRDLPAVYSYGASLTAIFVMGKGQYVFIGSLILKNLKHLFPIWPSRHCSPHTTCMELMLVLQGVIQDKICIKRQFSCRVPRPAALYVISVRAAESRLACTPQRYIHISSGLWQERL